MAAASSVLELCTLADRPLDAATSAKFFRDNDGAGGAISSFSWPEAEKTKSKLMSQSALQALCEKYKVPVGYTPTTVDGRWVACRTPPEGCICVYADALEAGMRIPLHEFYVAVLGHYGLAPSQLAPDAWRYMAAFVLLSKDAGVEPMLPVFLSFFSICTHKGDSVGWHYFRSRPDLFNGKMPRSPDAEWKSSFFLLQSPSMRPWPCPVKWGKPSRAAVRMPVVTGDTAMVMKKLLDTAGSSDTDIMQFLSRRSPPVAPLQLQFAPTTRDRVRPIHTPQQKDKLVKVGAAGAAAGPPQSPPPPPPPPPPPLEPTRKRKSFDTHTLVDCIAEASELAKKAMTELDKKGKELQATRGEVAQLKEQMRAVRAEHADHVAQLKEALSMANAQHAAEVCRLADEHHKASTAHAEEVKAECAAEVAAKLQAEHATVVSHLKENLKKEHASAVSQLTERLKKEHAAAVARLNEDHATSIDRLKEEHAADVARVKDAADKEVQDTKRNIMLHLFPKLDVSLLERPKLKGDPSSSGTGTPKAEGRS